MERSNGVRHANIYGGKDVQIGWIYDSSKMEFYPSKIDKNYKSSEKRKYNFIIDTKEDVLKYKSYDFNKDNQWYKDLHNHAKEIIYIYGSVDIENRASEVVNYETGQEIVTSLLNRIDVIMLIFLEKKLPSDIRMKIELKNFLNCVLEEKDDAFLPDCLTNAVITTNVYNGNKKKENKNTVYALKEGCRVLKTTFRKAHAAHTIDGSLQNTILTEQILQKDLQKMKINNADMISDSADRNTKVTNNQESEISNSTIPSAVEYSQMTKFESNQMTKTITCGTKINNAECRENKIVTTGAPIAFNSEKCTGDDETKNIMGIRSQVENSCFETAKLNMNQNKETIRNVQTTNACDNQLSTFIEINAQKRERNSSQERMPYQPNNAKESCRSTARGRSNSRKRLPEKAHVGNCDNQNVKQENYESIEKNVNQNIPSELINYKQNQGEKSQFVNEKKNINTKKEVINHAQYANDCKKKSSTVSDNTTPKRERSITRRIISNQLINTNESCCSTRGRSSSRKRNSMDKESISSHKHQNIKQETCTFIEKGTYRDVKQEVERKIKNDMKIENWDHTPLSTTTDSHQNLGKTTNLSKNSNESIPKFLGSINPRNINESGKLFGNDNTNSINHSIKYKHTFGHQTDIDNSIQTVMNDIDSDIKCNTNASSKVTPVIKENTASSNESKMIHSLIDKSSHTRDSNSSCTNFNAVSCQVSQGSSKNLDDYSMVNSSNGNSLVEDVKESNIRDLDQKHLKENYSSTPHKSTAFNEKSSQDNTSQSKSALTSSFSNLSTKTSNFFRILEPKTKMIDSCGIEKQFYGEFLQDLEEKVILLLGASGSGKTTLVNFVANYFEGVKTPDEKMVLVNPILANTKQSHTQEIKAYSFCSEKEPGFNFTFIDTPGLNDSSGAEVRDHVQSLKTFLANMNANGLKIHALGFVAQAHLVRLTSSERLVMDYVSTLFGEKVVENIITFVTFADNQENPPVVEAVQNYGLKTKHFLKFNNSILSANTYEVEDLDRVYWRKGFKSLKKGVKIIKDMSPLCVNAMKALQKEVYSKTVVDGAMKDLEAEVLNFVYIIEKGNDKENTKQAGSQVWELATAAYYQIKQSNNSYASVEDLVKQVTVELCQKKSIHPYECLKYLTFAPSRGMRPAALSIIYSLNIVYNSLKNNNTKAKNPNKKAKKSHAAINVMLFCHVCDKEHFMERISKSGWFGKDNSNTKEVILKCKECECAGDVHGVKVETNANHDLSINGILQHVRNGLCNVIQRYSIPGVTITDNELLQCLMEEVADQYKPFIKDLLHMRNIV